VGNVSTGLYSPEEVVRCPFSPVFKGLGFGESVKACIQLNRPIMLGIELKPLCLRTILRIEYLTPMIVSPTRSTDVDSG